MRFDCIFGNPPYQKEDSGYASSAGPIYHKFIKFSFEYGNYVVLITPSRWFGGGKGLDDFRKFMLNLECIKSINHFDDASRFFPDTEIKGGVNILFLNKNWNGNPEIVLNKEERSKIEDLSKYDILVKNPKAYSIVDKVLNRTKKTLDDLYYSSNFSGLNTNDERLKDTRKENHIKCYASQSKSFERWVHIQNTNNQGGGFWKVLTPRAAKKGFIPSFGNLIIAEPKETFTQSYIAFKVSSENEAKNLKHFLRLSLPEYMLSLRKVSQDISKKTLKWIPLLDLKRKWKNQEVFEYFELRNDEIREIKNKTN